MSRLHETGGGGRAPLPLSRLIGKKTVNQVLAHHFQKSKH
jgi:hypothetical protein